MEYVIMQMIRFMNKCWSANGFEHTVATTCEIIPGSEVGLIEEVNESTTLDRLKRDGQSVSAYLGQEKAVYERLSSTVAAYLAICYILGVGDGHGDNIMLKRDGSLFRIDFGYAFGKKPFFDAPCGSLPEAVGKTLDKADLWQSTITQSKDLVRLILEPQELKTQRSINHQILSVACEGFMYLSADAHEIASMHMSAVSFEGFQKQLNHVRGSFLKTLKNRLHMACGYRTSLVKQFACTVSAMRGGAASQGKRVEVDQFRRLFFCHAFAFAQTCFLMHSDRPMAMACAKNCLDAISDPMHIRCMVEFLVSDKCPPQYKVPLAFGLLETPLVKLKFKDLAPLAKSAIETRHGGNWMAMSIPVLHVMCLMVLSACGIAGHQALRQQLQTSADQTFGDQTFAAQGQDLPTFGDVGTIAMAQHDLRPLRSLLPQLPAYQQKLLIEKLKYLMTASDPAVSFLGRQALAKLGLGESGEKVAAAASQMEAAKHVEIRGHNKIMPLYVAAIVLFFVLRRKRIRVRAAVAYFIAVLGRST